MRCVFKWNDRSVFSTGAIRKNPATQDATDEAVQVNVMRYLKGASDREEKGKRKKAPHNREGPTADSLNLGLSRLLTPQCVCVRVSFLFSF